MTEKQRLFADEYLKDLNGTRAYKTIYTTIKNDNVAAVRANTLLKQKDISDYISKRLEEIHNENTADIQEVMEYLTSVLRGESASAVCRRSPRSLRMRRKGLKLQSFLERDSVCSRIMSILHLMVKQ